MQELQQRRLKLLLLLPLPLLPHQHSLQLLQLLGQTLHAAGQQLHIASLKHRCWLALCHFTSHRRGRLRLWLLLWLLRLGRRCLLLLLVRWLLLLLQWLQWRQLLCLRLQRRLPRLLACLLRGPLGRLLCTLLLQVQQGSGCLAFQLFQSSGKGRQQPWAAARGSDDLRTLGQLSLDAGQQLPLDRLQIEVMQFGR